MDIQELENEIKANLETAREELDELKEDVSYYKKYFWYFPCYLFLYVFVERIMPVQHYHALHCAVDNIIPFCEFFVIPYLGWIVAIFLLAFYCFKHEKLIFEKLIRYFIVCTVIVFLIFILFPSCQELRPEVFPRNNIFSWMTSVVYFFDTPTNTCPSMHVIGCMGLLFASWDIEKFRNVKARILLSLGAVLIILSTLFLKQHSFLDIVASVPICLLGWWLCFGDAGGFRKTELKAAAKRIFVKGKIVTVPNILTVFRLVLIPFIIHLYRRGEYYKAASLIVVSGVTDVMDGLIARKCNMISDLGKILDPIADKLTQFTLIFCLTMRYEYMWYLVAIIVVKELTQAVFGYLVLQRQNEIHSSQWFGKLSTVLLYTMSAVLIVFPSIQEKTANYMICICGAALVFALLRYSQFYLKLLYSEMIPLIRRRIFILGGVIAAVFIIVSVLPHFL